MYKVLIVDDELIHLKGLNNMVKKIRPDYMVYTAKNGKEALDLIRSNPVDIIITDIKMPIMDGLELIENVVDRYKSIKIILLSGHRYFEYAQKAIKIGVFDYLLKPINQEKIVNILEKAENSIRLDIQKKKAEEDLLKKLDNTLPIYFEHQMNKWVNGFMTQEELNEIEQIFPNKGKGLIVAVSICKYDNFVRNDNTQEIKQKLKYDLKKTLDTLGHSVSFFLEHMPNVLISIITFKEGLDYISKENENRLNEFILNAKETFEFNINVAISDISDRIFDEIKISFKQAIQALSYKFYFGNTRVIYYSKVCCNKNENKYDFSREENELKEAFEQIKAEKVSVVLESIYNIVFGKNEYPKPQQFIDSIIQLCHNTIKNVHNIVGKKIYDELTNDIKKELKVCEDYEELQQKLRSFFDKVMKILYEAKDKQHSQMMQKCIRYIEEHYMDDVSLEEVADTIYYSTSYFSTCFKKYCGMTFNQYISHIRIKKACELLEDTDYKVYKLAEMIGYKDEKYFYRVFKKKVGITPDEYRRNKKLYL